MSKPRCCSYCKEAGHNISNCNSPKIAELDKYGNDAGLIDIIMLLFCKSSILNDTVIYSNRYNYTKKWVNSLKKEEINILSRKHNFHKEHKSENIVKKRNRLFYYYFDDRLTNYSFTEYTLLIFDITELSKEDFIKHKNKYISFFEEGEIKREVVNEMNQIYKKLYEPKFKIKITKVEDKSEECRECPICYENEQTMITTNCNHHFCNTCVTSYLKSYERKHSKEPNCPMCRETISEFKTTSEETIKMLENNICNENTIVQPQSQSQSQTQDLVHLQSQQQHNINSHLVNILLSIVGF